MSADSIGTRRVGPRMALEPRQWRTIAGIGAVVVGLHVAGFLLLFSVLASARHHLAPAGAFTVGIGVTAYTLGMRHAFDADHIAAIDNTTRKLMGEGKRPLASASGSRSGTRRSCSRSRS